MFDRALQMEPSSRRPLGRATSTVARALVYYGPLVPPLGRLEDPLVRKPRATWHNKPRNTFPASLAASFADHRIDMLWKLGLLLDRTELPQPAP